MNTKSLVIIAGIGLIVGVIAYSQFKQEPAAEHIVLTAEEQAMLEHCKMMPGMPGCEPYHDLIQANIATFDRSTNDLPAAQEMSITDLEDGDVFALSADIVQKSFNEKTIRAFGYNGSVPGPTLRVKQHSEVSIDFTNNLDMETTVHWHGLRLDNRFDGVPDVTQDAVESGKSFKYKLSFPDPGIYWYHPHVREDYQQELGLYGAIIVEPEDEDYFAPVHAEEVVLLDDMLFDGSDVESFSPDFVDHALMGRFGNTLLANGKSQESYHANIGEIRRFYFVNTANARPFNIKIPGVQMRLIGSDAGGHEREEIVENIILSPSDRAIVDVFFSEKGEFEIIHETPDSTSTLAAITVNNDDIDQDLSFESARENATVQSEIKNVLALSSDEPQHTLRLSVEMGHQMEEMNMHDQHSDGIEWEDNMPAMNQGMTNQNTTWQLIDDKTGKINENINWKWKSGDIVKIRVVNDSDSDHPMQHPIHLHGQRFIVSEIDGTKQENLAWEDTIMVPTGSTYDLVVEVTNPGNWMLHCHIAEHMHSGMMTMVEVK